MEAMRRRLQKTILALASVLVGSCLITNAVAQPAWLDLDAAVSGGLTRPLAPSEFTDFWNQGFTLGFGVSYRVTPLLRLGLETGYSRHDFDATAYEASIADRYPNVQIDGNALNAVPLMLVTEIALLPRGTTRPFVSLGIGYYHLSVATPAVSGPNSSDVRVPDRSGNVAGLRLGLGVWTVLTPSSALFIEATYHVAWTEGEATSFLPLRLGVRF